MAKVCFVAGKRSMHGNRISQAANKSRRRFEPNLHWKRIWVPSENRFVRIRLSARGLKTIDKLGIDRVLRYHGRYAKKI